MNSVCSTVALDATEPASPFVAKQRGASGQSQKASSLLGTLVFLRRNICDTQLKAERRRGCGGKPGGHRLSRQSELFGRRAGLSLAVSPGLGGQKKKCRRHYGERAKPLLAHGGTAVLIFFLLSRASLARAQPEPAQAPVSPLLCVSKTKEGECVCVCAWNTPHTRCRPIG